jgi:hypothetical protein
VIRKRHNDHWFAWFYDETWRCNIEIIWEVNGKQVSRFIKDRHGLDYTTNDGFGAKCVELMSDGVETNIICLQWWPKKKRPTHYAMLSHEIFHATDHVLSARGQRLTRDSTEPYAYTMEGFMRRALTLLDTSRKVSP